METEGDRVSAAVREQPRSPWVAIDAQMDPIRWARLLRRAHELALEKGLRPSILREVVACSWQRATDARVDPDAVAPQILDGAATRRALADHPVSHLLPLVESMLAEATEEGRYFAVMSDAEGVLLWARGHPKALRIADGPGFLPGHLCSERAVGTNAIGTALELDHPVQIFSAEHFNRRLHGWTCSAAPIHDPESAEVLGVLDISGDFRTGHPHSLSLVSAVARVVEGELSRETARRNERLKALYLERLARGVKGRSALIGPTGHVLAASPHGWAGSCVEIAPERQLLTLPGGIKVRAEPICDGGGHILWQTGARRRSTRRSKLLVEALGRDRVRVSLDGVRMDLSPRHSEIVLLLVLNPEGVSGSELGSRLYGDDWRPVTVRAEISRLRQTLGPAVGRNPYRLDADVRADFLEVERLLEQGEIGTAVKRYVGRLLPGSEVPAIAEARQRVDTDVRSCALADGDAGTLYSWACRPPGRDDLEAHRRLLDLLDAADTRRAFIARRLEALGQPR
jgi:GAF domain